ncbi:MULTISPECIES: nitrite reductase small subunit NirD [unclassified Oleiphilus]|jgi:nitrite reductase (NADH) small subunit|uniref:nitrite reductase small subunit NirD n=2 Tax=Oleiphilus TaxID=141450 RepID=UPI0007C3F220|nr:MULTISPECIES: nitrite reductase small subunit NirD [unclassified Oleiphilus]KZY40178.1 nitrite reductase small subunit [Oleiphilus sp. HI0050]KZY82380.1 nitrite reductase small subunit [Oleiphilus sp. HI0069]KZY84679.1 nitrite reductase small subunit [Oleiphilus sp. HI0068]KZY93860.1 nitrite reductase small subunit [Oleiphilus sp. HI0072]KZZ10465.1 nitrite reductase small subunit [Oleiphilus sp. HI0078]KZZ18913.1 nitrite reductase small subunit [Oleiphilus sp. HI0081]KZZ31756.1 nitrite re
MALNEVICTKYDLVENSGVCALVNDEQVAIFYIPSSEEKIFAISNWDPCGKANVLSRGIVGDLTGKYVVASPLYKQHFDLKTGECLEEEDKSVTVYPVKLEGDSVLLA